MDNQRAIQLLQAHIDAEDMPLFSQAAGIGIRAIERVDGLEKELAELKESLPQRMLDWRGVETPCKRCGGSGRIGYGNTATWRGGIGGSMMTADVCSGCWGSGDEHRKGVDLRKVSFEDTRALRVELAEAREDAARKRWMCEQGCYMAHSRDGEDCHLIWPHNPNDEEGGEVVQVGNFSDHNAAIDAARAREVKG